MCLFTTKFDLSKLEEDEGSCLHQDLTDEEEARPFLSLPDCSVCPRIPQIHANTADPAHENTEEATDMCCVRMISNI